MSVYILYTISLNIFKRQKMTAYSYNEHLTVHSYQSTVNSLQLQLILPNIPNLKSKVF